MSSIITAHRPSPRNPSDSLRVSAIKKDMSITQTYYLAHKARGKLSREAAQPDHDLRLLVGHANLLDSLMLELAEAEREQERWFNQSVRGATKQQQHQDRRAQWADRIEEEAIDDEYDLDTESSDSDSDYDEEDIIMTNALPAAAAVTPVVIAEEMEEDDLEEDYAQLELVRTPSHTSPPPELFEQDSDSSEDEAMPPSPTDTILTFSEKEIGEEEIDNEAEQQVPFKKEHYYMPARNPARLVSAISVY